VQYRHVSKAAIVAEYAAASRRRTDFERAKWGTPEGMLNRFRLGLALVAWADVRRWLDIGCGTGAFFSLAEAAGHRFDELVGVDITPEIIAAARSTPHASPARFVNADLTALPADLTDFDLVTLVGVLQQCGAPPEAALPPCVACLRPGGQFLLTTKNLGWQAFTSGTLRPEQSHSWFLFDEIAAVLARCDIEILRSGGLLPRTGRVVPLAESHSMYIWGRKRGVA
jgi:SAM-dependent methyltransferase